MRMISWRSLCVAVLLCSTVRVAMARANKNEEWKGWKCDDMTPNLCDDLQVSKGSFTSRDKLKVHYWRYMSPNLDPETSPVVVINGGPGTSHNYDLPLRQLACREREVIFYDQAGTGESSLPPNTTVAKDYPFLLNASYYSKEELPALIKALELDTYHIVADSWGTMIAMQNEIYKRDPKLLSLSLNGPIPRATDYVDISWDPVEGSIGTLPYYIKSRMKAIQKSQDYESEEMQEIQMVVLQSFYSRNGLFADCALESFMTTNEEVVVGMWSAVDFFDVTGTLVDFDLWNDIGALKDIPILLTSGEFDIVRPVTVNALYKALPLSEKVLFPGSGHASIFDVTAQLLDTVNDFLERVEFSETDQEIVFVPKRPGEEKETIPQTFLQYVVAGVILIVTFIIGLVVGQSRGSQNRAEYSQIS